MMIHLSKVGNIFYLARIIFNGSIDFWMEKIEYGDYKITRSDFASIQIMEHYMSGEEEIINFRGRLIPRKLSEMREFEK